MYRDQVAVGLLDFDFAAPGRRVHDLATFARISRTHRHRPRRRPARTARALRSNAAAAGRCRRLRSAARPHRVVGRSLTVYSAAASSARRLDEGNVAFRQMVEATGGMAKFDRRRAWFTAHREPTRRRPRLIDRPPGPGPLRAHGRRSPTSGGRSGAWVRRGADIREVVLAWSPALCGTWSCWCGDHIDLRSVRNLQVPTGQSSREEQRVAQAPGSLSR